MDFWISDWISGFHIASFPGSAQLQFRVPERGSLGTRLDFTVDFWISQWISGFQFGFLPTVYEISFVTDPSTWVQFWSQGSDRNENMVRCRHG